MEKALEVEGSRKDTYDCAQCGGTFDKGWSDEEAMQESETNFGDVEAGDLAVICDDCHNIMMGN